LSRLLIAELNKYDNTKLITQKLNQEENKLKKEIFLLLAQKHELIGVIGLSRQLVSSLFSSSSSPN
jgi:hypothetical protein